MLLLQSVTLALSVTFLTLLVGVPLGILLTKTDIKGKNIFLSLFTFPLLLPPYTLALAWSHFFTEWFFSFWGVLLVEFSLYLPLPLLATVLLLKSVPPQLENAGRVLFSWRDVLRHITLPLLLPSLLFIATLVFLLSFSNYAVPNFLRYNSLIVNIFVEFSAFYHYSTALALSSLLLLFILFLFFFEQRYRQKHSFEQSLKNFHFENKNIIQLPYKKTITTFLILVIFSITLLPLLILLFDVSSFHTYTKAFQLAQESIVRSAVYAFLGAFSISFFGFIFAYVIHTQLLYFKNLFDILTLTLFALPSTLLGLVLLLAFNHTWSNFIYTSPLILLIAYTLKYTAVSSRIFLANLRQIPSNIEESGELLGILWWQRLLYILLPLLKKSFYISFVISFIFILRDTDLSMLLYTAGSETLSIKTFTLMANSPQELISALNLIMVFMILLPLTLLGVIL